MSMMVSFVLSFFPRDVLDEILNLIESVSEDFPSYSSMQEHGKLSLNHSFNNPFLSEALPKFSRPIQQYEDV